MKWICLTKKFNGFTYGKTYEGNKVGNNIDVTNDYGYNPFPAISGYNGPGNLVVYFRPVDEWRKKKINEILGLPINSN